MNKNFIFLIVAATLLLPCTAHLAAADQKASQATQIWSAKASYNDYRIGAGDVLEITTWKEPDLTRDEVLVRTDGKISFPMLNDVQAAGLSPM